MDKCCKTLIWIACALVILAALGVGIYFIISDAIDKKVDGCIVKHLHTKGLFEYNNITTPLDPAKIKFSEQECEYIIKKAHEKCLIKVKDQNLGECVSSKANLDIVLLAEVVKRKSEEGAKKFFTGALQAAMKECAAETTTKGAAK